jgi:hypothetical protein
MAGIGAHDGRDFEKDGLLVTFAQRTGEKQMLRSE